MAYSKHSSQREDMLACSVCFEYYVEPYIPKNLDCGHVCCQECLAYMISKSKKGNVVCPECRSKMRVPGGKIDSLPTNFPLKSLAEHEQQKLKESTPVVRRTTLRRRVTILRERESVVVHREKPDTDDQQEDELETLRLKIECLEQQLQHQQQLPNEPIYVQLEEDEEREDGPLQESEGGDGFTPVSHHPLPSAPPLEPTVPPPLPDRPPPGQPLHHSNTLPTRPGIGPPHPSSSMTSSMSASRMSLPAGSKLYQELLHHGTASQQPAEQTVLRRQLQQIEEFGTFEQAQGIALTSDGLIVVCDFKGEAVTVFHRKKKGPVVRKFSLSLNTRNPNRPADVATTNKGGFLVARRTCVEMYSPKGKYDRKLPTAFKGTTGVCTVTTRTDGKILVGDITNYSIIIYNAKGDNILQKISTVTKPARIAALGGILIAVSHARSGKVEIFDTALGQSFKVINIPEVLGMCYDPHTNRILVVRNARLEPGSVECHTGVVEQYNAATGVLKEVLVERLYHPFHLTFTANGLLAVADKTSVKLFNVKDGHREGQPIYE